MHHFQVLHTGLHQTMWRITRSPLLRMRPPHVVQNTVMWSCLKTWRRHRLVDANPESLMGRAAIDWSQRSISENLINWQRIRGLSSYLLDDQYLKHRKRTPSGRTNQSHRMGCLLKSNPSCRFCSSLSASERMELHPLPLYFAVFVFTSRLSVTQGCCRQTITKETQ